MKEPKKKVSVRDHKPWLPEPEPEEELDLKHPDWEVLKYKLTFMEYLELRRKFGLEA